MSLFSSLLCVAFVLFLELLYPARVFSQKNEAARALHKPLRKAHAAAGFALIPIILFHCGTASQASGERSFFGGILLILSLLLALTYLLRKPLGASWKPLHRTFAALLAAVTLYHGLFEFI